MRYDWPRADYLRHIKECGLCRVNRIGCDNAGKKTVLDHDTISFLCPRALAYLKEIEDLF